jgi:MFS family permease
MRSNRDLVAPGLGFLVGMSAISTASVASALPDIVSHFNMSYEKGTWVITAYAVTLAISSAVYGRLCRRVGHRAALTIGICTMAVGAVGAAASPTFGLLIASRFFQGAGAGAAPVLSVAVMHANYRGEARSPALAKAAGFAVGVTAFGPLLGGALTTTLSWRAALLPPVIAVLVLPVLWRSLPSSRTPAPSDLLGALLTGTAAGSLVLLAQSRAVGQPFAIVAFSLAVVTLPSLAWRVRRRPDGFLPSAVLTMQTVRVSVATAALPAAWFGMLTAIPAALAWRGWSATAIGIALLPGGLLALAVSGWTGKVLNRIGPRRALTISVTGSGAAVFVAALASDTSPALMIAAVVVVYGGFALGQPAMAATVTESAPAGAEGQAMGVATLIFFVGGALGAAIAGQGAPPEQMAALLVLSAVIFLAAIPACHRLQ